MSEHSKQIAKLNALLNKEHTIVSNEAKNTQINIHQKIASFNNRTTDYSDKFAELPAFCEHLPTEFKNAMIAMNQLHNTPYEFSLPCLLGMANSCSQHLYDVDSYKYGIKPISLFMMGLLGTGGSKSTTMGMIEGPLKEFEKRMNEALKNEDARFAVENKLYKNKIKKYEKDVEDGLSPPFPMKPIPAETAYYLNQKFTINGFMETLSSQPHACIITAEAGEFFSGHAFQGGKQDANRAVEMTTALTKLWDGSNLMRVVKDERVMLDNRRVNSFFLVQEGVIRDVLSNRTFQEQGFTHRILIFQIKTFEKPDIKFTPESDLKEETAKNGLKPYLDKLEVLLSKRPTKIPERLFELQPIVISSTQEAKVYMGDFANECKFMGYPGNKLEKYEGFSSRIHEHMIRIAGTFAAFNDREHVEITIDEAKAAVDIMKLFIEHRSNLDMGIQDTRPDLSQGAGVLETWFKNHQDKSFTKRDLARNGPPGFKTISDSQRITILEELLSSEIIVATETVAKNGRKTLEYTWNKD